MKKYYFLLISFLGLLIFSCNTTKTHSISTDYRYENNKIQIDSVDVCINGITNLEIEEQVRTITESLIKNEIMESQRVLSLEIKINEKSFFSETNFLHSLFLVCTIYDENNNKIATISEYSTGKDTFQAPDIQEKYLRKCILEIKEMKL